jgi:hypothetical protein
MNTPQYQSDVPVTSVYTNTSQELINITRDRLKIKLLEHIGHIDKRWTFLGPLSFCASVIMTFATAEFKKWLGIEPQIWCGVYIALLTLGFAVTILKLKYTWSSISIDDFIEKIKTEK